MKETLNDNPHEQLIEEIYKIRDEMVNKTKHTGLTNRNVLEAVTTMFECVINGLKLK
jgi:hypothetical protein